MSVSTKHFSAGSKKIKKEMDINGDILRFLIIKTVRENTMFTPKYQATFKSNPEEKVSKEVIEPAEKIEISEEEIDKSIDELLVEEVKN
jgi:hypothetical protein